MRKEENMKICKTCPENSVLGLGGEKKDFVKN